MLFLLVFKSLAAVSRRLYHLESSRSRSFANLYLFLTLLFWITRLKFTSSTQSIFFACWKYLFAALLFRCHNALSLFLIAWGQDQIALGRLSMGQKRCLFAFSEASPSWLSSVLCCVSKPRLLPHSHFWTSICRFGMNFKSLATTLWTHCPAACWKYWV